MTTPTRERLLKAARDLWLREGVQGTTIRALTSSASANVAAVNYHFGSRSGLLREVALDAARQLTAAWEVSTGSDEAAAHSPHRAFVESLARDPTAAALVVRALVAPEGSIPRLVAAELAEGLESWVGQLWPHHPTRTRPEVHASLVRALIGMLPLVADPDLLSRLGAGRYRALTMDQLIAHATRNLEKDLEASGDLDPAGS